MAARMVMRWHLRQVMATRGMFQTSELVRVRKPGDFSNLNP